MKNATTTGDGYLTGVEIQMSQEGLLIALVGDAGCVKKKISIHPLLTQEMRITMKNMTDTNFNMREHLYHDDGSFKITMMDVRRLLPGKQVKDFKDLRNRGLVNDIEKLFNKYLDLGGEHGIAVGVLSKDNKAERIELPPMLFSLTSMSVIKKITGRKPLTTVEILNQ
jgi:hypothetical protein